MSAETVSESSHGEFFFARPTTTDAATFDRIVFIRPLEAVAQPIIDHNVRLIGDVHELAPWYRG